MKIWVDRDGLEYDFFDKKLHKYMRGPFEVDRDLFERYDKAQTEFEHLEGELMRITGVDLDS